MRATMEDIARECGVTKMTVSRVLAGRSGVRDVTREKVLSAAKRLNYELNALAQNLSINRSGFVGVATPFAALLGSGYFEQVFRGFKRALGDRNLDFALFDTWSESFDDGTKLARLYRQRKVDGLLVVALHTTDHFLDTLEHERVPLVIVGAPSPRATAICSVCCDDAHGIKLLCNHLYEHGHRRIAFVEGPREVASSNRRRHTFQAFCRAKHLTNPAWYMQHGSFTMRSGRDAGRNLLTKPAGERPTAIIASNDTMALGVIEATRELNLRIPQDVSICGFDNSPDSADYFPSLTTINQPAEEIGEQSARLLYEAIDRDELPQGYTNMDVTLVVRESTGPVPTE